MTRLVANLYETDHYVWALAQASTLRRLQAEGSNIPLDLDHLAEEMEALAKSDRNAVRSQIRRILEHFLKLEHSPAAAPRDGWRRSIVEARLQLRDDLTPTLERDAEQQLDQLSRDARRLAASSLEEHDETAAATALPERCPYSLDEIIAEDWWPEPPQDRKQA
jgi:hypothetical protein